jgi:hypothetical protein
MLQHGIFFLFFFLCLSFPPQGGEKNHQETRTSLHQYMGGNWKALQEEHMIKTLILIFHKRLESTPNLIPPPLARLCCARALTHVKEYV